MSADSDYQQADRRFQSPYRRRQNFSPADSIAPAISFEGPDPHVLAARAERAMKKQARIDGVSGASSRMSDADIAKLQSDGTVDEKITSANGTAYNKRGFVLPGESLENKRGSRSLASMTRDQTSYQDKARAFSARTIANNPKVQAARAKVEAETAAFGKAFKPTLYPGEFINVEKGSPENKGRVGMVRDDSGKMVPIAGETKRLADIHKPALDRAEKNAEETAAYMQRVQNPGSPLSAAVTAAGKGDQKKWTADDAAKTLAENSGDHGVSLALANKADEYQKQRANDDAAQKREREAAKQVRIAQGQPGYNPSREEIIRNNAAVKGQGGIPKTPGKPSVITVPRVTTTGVQPDSAKGEGQPDTKQTNTRETLGFPGGEIRTDSPATTKVVDADDNSLGFPGSEIRPAVPPPDGRPLSEIFTARGAFGVGKELSDRFNSLGRGFADRYDAMAEKSRRAVKSIAEKNVLPGIEAGKLAAGTILYGREGHKKKTAFTPPVSGGK